MYKHHQEAIDNISRKMEADPEVQALIIAGSIAHGFALPESDVDILIVVTEEDYEKRKKENRRLYWEDVGDIYEGGYIDGKYITVDFIRNLTPGGNEPEKFAFTDVYAAFSRIPGLDGLMKQAAGYPARYRDARMRRLFARFHEWNYFYEESRKKNNLYLETKAVCNLIHFGGRSILAYNRMLYPFHKWLLRVLESAPEKPDGIMSLIQTCVETRSPDTVKEYIETVKGFTDWGFQDKDWPKILMSGEELGCWDADW